WKAVVRTMFQRGWVFVVEAGKVIMVISVILWFLASYPKQDVGQPPLSGSVQVDAQPAEELQNPDSGGSVELESAQQLKQSYAGQFGRLIEPAIAPLGFDWKIGIALLTSFAAREV